MAQKLKSRPVYCWQLYGTYLNFLLSKGPSSRNAYGGDLIKYISLVISSVIIVLFTYIHMYVLFFLASAAVSTVTSAVTSRLRLATMLLLLGLGGNGYVSLIW
jgi:hypothetical protein